MSTQSLLERRFNVLGRHSPLFYEKPLQLVRGEGVWVYDADGKLRSNALSTYKVPDIYSIPKEIDILPLETTRQNLAIFNSKALGEPPLMYGIGAYFDQLSFELDGDFDGWEADVIKA